MKKKLLAALLATALLISGCGRSGDDGAPGREDVAENVQTAAGAGEGEELSLAYVPREIAGQSICIRSDIGAAIRAVLTTSPRLRSTGWAWWRWVRR